MAISFIPMLLLFPVGGVIADRVNKRNIMVIVDFSTAVFILLFCLLEPKLDIVPLIVVTMIILCGLQGAYQPAVNASIPFLLAPEYIIKGNSIVNMINSVASMAGPVTGGILFSVAGLKPILYVSIACFFISAVMELFIHIPYKKRKTKDNIVVTGLKDLQQSLHFMFRSQPVLWKISLIYSSMGLLLTSLVLIAVPVLITQRLGFEPAHANRLYGYAQGVSGGGAVAGGLLAGICANKLKPKMSPYILIACALSVLLPGIALQLITNNMQIYIFLLIGSGLLIALSTVFQIQIMSYLQLLTPKEMVGKIIACFISICMCAIPAGQFIYGYIFENTVSRSYLPFYAAALLMIGISLFTRKVFYRIGV